MEKDLISVIIPVYNIEIYIKRCVNSIINQTYKNLEIILVDDGSTDNSGKICDDYEKKDARIKVIHKENGGLSDARNCGIEKSNGKYITTVDGDDFVTEKYVETLYNLIIENSADISSINRFDFLENDANGKCIKVEYYNNCPKVTVFSSKEYEIKSLLKAYTNPIVVLQGHYHERLKLCFLPTDTECLHGYWFGFETETQKITPVFKAKS